MKQILNIAAAAILFLATGCATPPSTTADTAGPIATCHVCRYNNDLACVRVTVKESTPRLEYAGQTYYFCSEDCRAEFQGNAAKYLPKK